MVIKRNTVSLAGLVSVVLVGASFAFTDATYAATYSTSISTSGSVSLNVGMNGNGANIATDNVKVVSTCPAGYTVGIAATSATNASFNDTTLYKDGNTANNASSQKILSSTGTKDTPVSILNDNKKTWGYSIANDTTIHSNFIGLTATQAVLTTSAIGTTATGVDLPVYYGASVDDAIEPGEYKMSDNAVITYYLTANLDCTSYQVAFNSTSIFEGNTITGTGTMSNQRISEGVATPLDANGFTAPSGYYFAGWNTAQDGTGTSYTDGQSVTDLTTAGNTITLYAQWTNIGPVTTIADGVNLQDISSKSAGGCPDTLTVGQIYTLTDSRDNSSYRVARLADGNCWMLDNLSLDITNPTVQSKLDSTTTNASDLSLSYLKGDSVGAADDQYAKAPVSKAWTSAVQDSYTVPMIAVDSNTSGPCAQSSYCANNDLSWASSDDITSTFYNNEYFTTQGRIGIYYNLCAVSAGSYCWSTLQSYDVNIDEQRYISEDICPKGWSLPADEWGYCDGDSCFSDAVSLHHITLSGYFHSGNSYNHFRVGEFWGRNIDSGGYLLGLQLDDKTAYPDGDGWISNQYYMNPDYGYSARCVLAP